MDAIVVRRATELDLRTLGRLGALLMQTHYAFDQQWFMAPGKNPAEEIPPNDVEYSDCTPAWFLDGRGNQSVVELQPDEIRAIVGNKEWPI
jgi:hypothetical protein